MLGATTRAMPKQKAIPRKPKPKQETTPTSMGAPAVAGEATGLATARSS